MLVFALGLGSALGMPVSGALVPEVVDDDELGPASAWIGGVGSLAAAVGPMLAGLAIAAGGPVAIFAVDALLFVGAIALVGTGRPDSGRRLPAEHLPQAIRLGLRYGHYAAPFRGLLIRAAAFALLASAGPALFPLVARLRLAVDAGGLGLFFGLVGAGAAAGALAVPAARKRVSLDGIAAGGTVLVALGLSSLALGSSFVLVGLGLVAMGFGQSALTTSLVLAAQRSLAEWVRGRGLSLYLLVFYLATTFGSALWGLAATRLGLSTVLLGAAIGVLATLPLAVVFRLGDAERLDSAPIGWPALTNTLYLARHRLDDGPVLMTITYQVDDGNSAAFVEAMCVVGEQRRRDGAMQWGFYQNVDQPDQYVEVFMAASWAEHLRQRERPTQDDLAAWESVRPLYREVRVQHFIAPGAWRRLEFYRQAHREHAFG